MIATSLNQLALQEGKKRQSFHTSFLHSLDGQLIPIYDNLLFVLALFRSKNAENIQQAKTLLEKLLQFQSIKDPYRHRFPQFLHEYPYAYDLYLQIKFLSVLYQIFSEFSSILGKPLKLKLTFALKRLYSILEKTDLSFPNSFIFQILAHLFFHTPLEYKIFADAKENLLNCNSEDLGHILHAISLLQEKDSLWLNEAEFLYHELFGYIGPYQAHEGYRPKRGLLDLQFFSKPFEDSILLEGAKIYPKKSTAFTEERKIHTSYIGSLMIYRSDQMAFFLLQKRNEPFPKNFPLLRLFWGKEHPHSFVIQDFPKEFLVQQIQDTFTFLFTLPAILPEETEEEMALTFYLDALYDTKFFIGSMRTNTFSAKDVLCIVKEGMKMQLSFECNEGKFFGQILKANRPSQTLLPTKTNFNAYDWKIGIRTIRRSPSCKLAITLKCVQI